MVIGPPGSGKSTLSRQLAPVTGLPLVHPDRRYWKPGWVAPLRSEWIRMQREMVDEPAWIIDGNYGSTMDVRLGAADDVIFLDFPRHTYLWWIVKRMLRSFLFWEQRSDLAPGCPERPDGIFIGFFGWVWRFHRDVRPGTLGHLEDSPPRARLLWLRHPREITPLLSGIPFRREPGADRAGKEGSSQEKGDAS